MKKQHTLLLTTLFMLSCSSTVDSPSQVAEKYWSAIQQGDTETAKQFITSSSNAKYNEHIKSLEKISIENFVVDNEKTTVTTIINPEAPVPGDELIFNTRLVLENNQWKIDLNNTQVPQLSPKEKELKALADELSKTMQKNVESMEDVLGEGMGMLNDVLRDGSEEMGKSMLEAMKGLNDKMKESVERMKEHRNKNDNKPKQADDKAGEGLI